MDVDTDLDLKPHPSSSASGGASSSSSTAAPSSLAKGLGGKSRGDPTRDLPHDQLAKMFPTPPSHEHHAGITSPADVAQPHDIVVAAASGSADGGAPGVSGCSGMLTLDASRMDWSPAEDANLMFSSLIFAPVKKLYSDEFPPVQMGPDMSYKPMPKG